MLAHDRLGEGPPLVLLHFLGGHRHVWGPVLPRLAERRHEPGTQLPHYVFRELRVSQELRGSQVLERDAAGELGVVVATDAVPRK